MFAEFVGWQQFEDDMAEGALPLLAKKPVGHLGEDRLVGVEEASLFGVVDETHGDTTPLTEGC